MSAKAADVLRKLVSKIPLTPTSLAKSQINITSGILFRQNLLAAQETIKQAQGEGLSGTYGDTIRSAYQNGLNQSVHMASSGHFDAILPGLNPLVESTIMATCFREGVKMHAWDAMPPEDTEKLKERNIEKYGRKEGPDTAMAIERTIVHMEENGLSYSLQELFEIVRDKALGKTSEEYNADFGVSSYPIIAGPTGDSSYFEKPTVSEKTESSYELDELEEASPTFRR